MFRKNICARLTALTIAAIVAVGAVPITSISAYADTSDIITNANISMKVSMATIDNLTSDSSMAVRLQNLAIQQLLLDYYDLNARIEKLEAQVAKDKTNPVLSASLDAAIKARDAKWEAYQDARENIGDVITPQIANIKIMYLSYANALLQEQKIKLSIEKAGQDYELGQKKLALKYISQTQLDALKDAYDKLVNNQDSIIASRKNALEKLFNALGLPAEAEVVSPELFDVTLVNKLDYISSLQAALTKNKAIKDAQDAVNDARNINFPYTDIADETYDVKVAKTKLLSLQNARTELFTQTYDSLMNAYDSYKKANVILERDLKKVSQMEAKYKLGYISKKQLSDFNRNIESEKIQQKIDNFSLYSQYISVQNAMKGF